MTLPRYRAQEQPGVTGFEKWAVADSSQLDEFGHSKRVRWPLCKIEAIDLANELNALEAAASLHRAMGLTGAEVLSADMAVIGADMPEDVAQFTLDTIAEMEGIA